MDTVQVAISLKREGRFRDALRIVQSGPQVHSNRPERLTLELELLERVGQHAECREKATTVLSARNQPSSVRGACDLVLGRIENENGRIETALTHLQRAQATLVDDSDLEYLCWAQIASLLIISERSGPSAAAQLFDAVRSSVTRLGEPQMLAALHIFVGEMEAKYGRLRSAIRLGAIAKRFLAISDNVWLRALAENLDIAVRVVGGDASGGLEQGEIALELAEQSGVASTMRACLGNIANLYYLRGHSDIAVGFFERALTTLPSEGEKTAAILESIARIKLDQGKLDECRRLLNSIVQSVSNDADRALYAHRHAHLLSIELSKRDGRIEHALQEARNVIAVATKTSDENLLCKGLIATAELLAQSGRVADATKALQQSLTTIPSDAVYLVAQLETAIVSCSLEKGQVGDAYHRYARARRALTNLSNQPALERLDRLWQQHLSTCESQFGPSDANTRQTIGDIAALFTHAGHPELIAREIVDLVAATDTVHGAAALARSADGTTETLVHCGDMSEATAAAAAEQRLAIGAARGRDVEVVLRVKDDIECLATANAITVLVASVREIDRARAEREERATLWPVDELPSDDGRSITVGHMRDMMALARRVATANVSVLVTGESGTGKEVIARAIHQHSSRAGKPFVPFNCTAVPRDMLDSQLFGHRRGAFTGADRDNPGVIRGARDGTLFLDEIGELGIDLQPKLLRFLESGEICPLGESAPLTVNVRIVAATNMNLEAAVREGRFREDLFYRLNVIRLTLKPLRERRDEIPTLVNHFLMLAAEELHKTHLRIAEETIERLVLYSWPGNVRQLQNEIRRMVALAESDTVLAPSALSPAIQRETDAAARPRGNGRELAVPLTDKLHPTLSRIEREMIKVALREHDGQLEAAAQALGISRKGLYLKRQRFGL